MRIPYLDEVYLLKTALRPAGRALSGNELTIVRAEDLEALEPGEFDVVILANVSRLGTGGLRNLEAYVRGGGGLIVFAGDRVDSDYYTGQLYAGGAGLLPAAVGDVVPSPTGAAPFAIGEWDGSHPVMRAFVDELAPVLRGVQVGAYVESETVGGGRGAVFARLDDPARSPVMLERRYGQGVCVLVTTSCDQEWNDWAASFSYVPMMLELVQHAARRSGAGMTGVVGAPLVCSVGPDLLGHSAFGWRRRTIRLSRRTLSRSRRGMMGECLLAVRSTRKTGVYRIELTGAGGEAVVRHAAVNPDARESNLAGAGRGGVGGSDGRGAVRVCAGYDRVRG